MSGTYPQQGYRPPQAPTSWGPPEPPPVQQLGYGYIQPGAYPAPPPQYDTSQPTYAGYPPQPISSGWDQTPVPPSQQTTQGSGYDCYSQHPPPGDSSTQDDTTGYNYHQAPASNYYQQQVSHGAPNYSQPPPSGQQQGCYLQPYDQLQGYNSTPSYGTGGVNSTQDISPQGWPTQVPPAQPPPAMQSYTGQQPNTTPTSYPSQGPVAPTQSGYPSTSPPPGYGSQQPTGTSYVQSSPVAQPNYGPPQGQKPPSQAVYGQTPPSNSQGGYIQGAAVQPGYSHSQHQSAQPALGSAAPQQGYVQQPYGVPPTAQPGYGQQQQPYGESYDGGYSQPLVHSSDRTVGGNVRGTIDAVAPDVLDMAVT